MTISPQASYYVQELLATGLYGRTADEVIETLVYQQLRFLLKEGVLEPAKDNTLKPRCPRCGSPRVNDISGMGDPQYQCLDCDTRFA